MNKRYQVTVNGRTISATVTARSGSQVDFTVAGRAYQVCVEPEVQLEAHAPLSVPQTAPLTSTPRPAPSFAGASNTNEVRAPMPGLVVDIKVHEGQTVTAGQPLLVIEAMKMENNIPAPRAGVIKKIHAIAGKEVEGRALLIELQG